jgi:hypothetical protein
MSDPNDMNELKAMVALVQAVAFASDKHRNQRRKDADASPYINQPIALASVHANGIGVQDVTVLGAAVFAGLRGVGVKDVVSDQSHFCMKLACPAAGSSA